ncbi:hypothetical protein N7528_006536 [Penicillium herquei]|nr:hypothetical protein N7528_006536 [Penicillium herquei]
MRPDTEPGEVKDGMMDGEGDWDRIGTDALLEGESEGVRDNPVGAGDLTIGLDEAIEMDDPIGLEETGLDKAAGLDDPIELEAIGLDETAAVEAIGADELGAELGVFTMTELGTAEDETVWTGAVEEGLVEIVIVEVMVVV